MRRPHSAARGFRAAFSATPLRADAVLTQVCKTDPPRTALTTRCHFLSFRKRCVLLLAIMTRSAAMRRKHLRFGKGLRVALGNARSQAAEMVSAPGDAEGDAHNRHRGTDQWLFVVTGRGTVRVNGKRYSLAAGSLLLIEHGDRHEIKNTGGELLRTRNIYVPPAYSADVDELPPAKA